MRYRFTLMIFGLLAFSACQKEIDHSEPPVAPEPEQWVEHIIATGAHNSDKNNFKSVNTAEMKFIVKFNNSAIYQTVDPDNQADINKLYGFSDNNQEHHTNSARIGWRWYNNELQLLAYVYNNTLQTDNLITAVPLDQDIHCSIKVQGNTYHFNVNGTIITMPRASTTPKGVGYQLYPYFGGDEPAPQEIRIQIKDLK